MLQAEEVVDLITRGFKAEQPFFRIEELRHGFVRARLPFKPWMLRPGNVISGPALFTAADLAMYALVLAHTGPQLMAVTSSLGLNFVNKGIAADIRAEGSLLKLGRKLAVMEVKLWCGDEPELIAHATGSYAIPAVRHERAI